MLLLNYCYAHMLRFAAAMIIFAADADDGPPCCFRLMPATPHQSIMSQHPTEVTQNEHVQVEVI